MLDTGYWKMYHLFTFDRLGKKINMSYRNLEIWRIADELSIEIHLMTLKELPKFEMFEVGSQIRRSIKSVKSNIAEGYGRRNYKQEYLHFLSIAIASNDESIDHLETLFKTGSLNDQKKFESLDARMNKLGRKLNLFIQAVEKNHKSKK
jgi:four helix bundle protein